MPLRCLFLHHTRAECCARCGSAGRRSCGERCGMLNSARYPMLRGTMMQRRTSWYVVVHCVHVTGSGLCRGGSKKEDDYYQDEYILGWHQVSIRNAPCCTEGIESRLGLLLLILITRLVNKYMLLSYGWCAITSTHFHPLTRYNQSETNPRDCLYISHLTHQSEPHHYRPNNSIAIMQLIYIKKNTLLACLHA
jgi:hypothetical protein